MISLVFHAFPGKWNAPKRQKRWFSLLFATKIDQNGTKIIQKPRAHLAKTFVFLMFLRGVPLFGLLNEAKNLCFPYVLLDFR